jgi:hypothetical protein
VRATTASAAATPDASRGDGVARRAPRLGPHLDQEHARAACDNLRQDEIEAVVRLRSSVHGNAKAGSAARCDGAFIVAVNRSRLVLRINAWPSQEDLVLDGDGMQFAGADADERQTPRTDIGLLQGRQCHGAAADRIASSMLSMLCVPSTTGL